MAKYFEVIVNVHKSYAVRADSESEAREAVQEELMGDDHTVLDALGPITDENSISNLKICADETI